MILSKVKVYTASRLSQLDHWRQLIVDWPEVEFTARWVRNGVTLHADRMATPEFLCQAWQENVEDVTDSDAVLVAPPGDGGHLRGALVEVGVGIALRKTIVVVGDCLDYGTWKHHPFVHKAASWNVARSILKVVGGLK
jgi:hypothetical protein